MKTKKRTLIPFLGGLAVRTAVVLGIGLISLALSPAPQPVSAQSICGDYKELASRLTNGFREVPVGMGLIQDGGVMQVFASDQGATWSILLTTPDGISCLIATGDSWEAFKNSFKGPQT